MEYTGQKYGAMTVVGPVGEHHKPGRHRRWVVRWDCCETEQVVKQGRLEDRRVHPVDLCPACRLDADAPKVRQPDLSGAIRHPQWGWVWPLVWHPPLGFETVRAARLEWAA